MTVTLGKKSLITRKTRLQPTRMQLDTKTMKKLLARSSGMFCDPIQEPACT